MIFDKHVVEGNILGGTRVLLWLMMVNTVSDDVDKFC